MAARAPVTVQTMTSQPVAFLQPSLLRPFGAFTHPNWQKSLRQGTHCSRYGRLQSAGLHPRMASDGVNVTSAPSIPTLEELKAKLQPIDYINGPLIASPTSELQSFRLFNQREADVRVVLYRDHASWCPYCHKVSLSVHTEH